ncbi:ADP-ribosylglycohydrolase [Clostridiaceae bacterium OM08-6BH]|nr:ADP-ribosylglycohydrolase [Clostridiaceae bacterium OM08-6BH]
MSNIWKDGMLGLIVGDALGVPVEFMSRTELMKNPVTGMREYGTHHQPRGTWSDDSSMALAELDSIRTVGTIDYTDMMERFSRWCMYGEYTPFGEVFDIGIATSRALMNYAKGIAPLESGGKTEWDNGNGSLMRILPVCLYLFERQKKVCTSENESIYMIHAVSALTHAHVRSQMACGIYYFLVKAILEEEGSLENRLQKGMDRAYQYYRQDLSNHRELENYKRLADLSEFKENPKEGIKSSGYVVDTLEAAVWCLLHSHSYKETVLMAVNLGEDTDTIGAVAGGLAGLYYKEEGIPQEWTQVLQRREWIEEVLQGI